MSSARLRAPGTQDLVASLNHCFGKVISAQTDNSHVLLDRPAEDEHRSSILFTFSLQQPHMALTVAVAGATGAVGRTIVEQILNENKFSVVALTRRVCSSKANPPNSSKHTR